MRISTNYKNESAAQNISSAAERLSKLQNMVASGKRINKASDDPAGVMRLMTMRSAYNTNKQYQTNIATAKQILQTSENSLSELTTMMNSLQQIAIRGASDTLDSSARNGLANEVEQMMSRFVDLINNTEYDGQAIFSGAKTDVKPLTIVGDTATYNGNDKPINFEVSNNFSMQVGLSGEPIFTDIYNTMRQLRDDLKNSQLENISNSDLATIKDLIKDVADARSIIGSKIGQLEALNEQSERRNDALKEMMANIEEPDLTAAITEMGNAELAYQAALTVTSKTFGLSLMDFLSGG